jgi:hypothetical protein
MIDSSDTPASRSTDIVPSPDGTRCDGWTRARQAQFLLHLSATHSVAAAARAVGMSRQSAYALRARLKGEPFDLAWIAALRARFDALAEAALDRALNGVEVPHFHQGELVHTSRKFDERLTLALLAMRDQFRPPRVAPYEPASAYGEDDFAGLVERIRTGPETWREERDEGWREAYRDMEPATDASALPDGSETDAEA